MKYLKSTAMILSLLLSVICHASDTVDLQWALCSPGATVASVFHISSDVSKTVTYFENSTRTLRDSGISLKITQKEEKTPKSEVKIALAANEAPSDADCEFDRYGARVQSRCKIENKIKRLTWSEEQKDFARSKINLDWNSLVAYGPYQEKTWSGDFNNYNVSLDELYVNNLGSFVELSIKVDSSVADRIYSNVTNFLKQRNIVICPFQEGKVDRIFRALQPH